MYAGVARFNSWACLILKVFPFPLFSSLKEKGLHLNSLISIENSRAESGAMSHVLTVCYIKHTLFQQNEWVTHYVARRGCNFCVSSWAHSGGQKMEYILTFCLFLSNRQWRETRRVYARWSCVTPPVSAKNPRFSDSQVSQWEEGGPALSSVRKVLGRKMSRVCAKSFTCMTQAVLAHSPCFSNNKKNPSGRKVAWHEPECPVFWGSWDKRWSCHKP